MGLCFVPKAAHLPKNMSFQERVEQRPQGLEWLGSPDQQQPLGNIATYAGFVAALDQARNGVVPVTIKWQQLKSQRDLVADGETPQDLVLRSGKGGELDQLYAIATATAEKPNRGLQESRKASLTREKTRLMQGRGQAIEKRNPGTDGLTRAVGSQVGRLGGCPKSDWATVAEHLIKMLPRAAATPREFLVEPPKSELLTAHMLTEAACEVMRLAEDPNSIIAQLMDPIHFAAHGIAIDTRSKEDPRQANQDFLIFRHFVEILKTLKHKDSEAVLKEWLTGQLTGTGTAGKVNAEVTLTFLDSLVTFTTLFLDPPSLLKIWGPPKTREERAPEILLQPFSALLGSLTSLEVTSHDPQIASTLLILGSLIKHRYGQVIQGKHPASMITARAEALIPAAEEFAELGILLTAKKLLLQPETSSSVIARALIKLADSVGIANIKPLLNQFSNIPDLYQSLELEAKTAGLIEWPTAFVEKIAELRRNPRQDAADLDYNERIKRGITDYVFYLQTGSYAPYTRGHDDGLNLAYAHLSSLPEQSEDGRKQFQREVLIAPITRHPNNPTYTKAAAQVGPQEIRVMTILLQADPRFLVSTALQPDSDQVESTEQKVNATILELQSRVRASLRKAGRAAGFRLTARYIYGPDEISSYKDEHGELHISPKQNQPTKIVEEGGIVVSREGWNLVLIENWELLSTETGTSTVIFAPVTPYTSSTRVIKEIAQHKTTRAVKATALPFVLEHYSESAIEERTRKPVPHRRRSVGKTNEAFLEKQAA